MDIVDRIKELCHQKDITLTELERNAGIGRSTIRNWATSSPNSDKLQKVADYFHVSVDYLLGRENSQKTSLNARDKRDIAKSLEDIMENLEHDGVTAYGGKIDDEHKELYRTAIQNALEIIKLKNKETYTPKKYKK